MKKIIIIVVVIIIIVGIYVVFTLKSGSELQETSPLDSVVLDEKSMIQDKFELMDSDTMARLKKETEAMKSEVMVKTESMPKSARLIAQADFKPRIHSVKGRVLLIENEQEKILRFEDFETDNGPNLHIYLSTSLGDEDFIDLGKIRATKGNVNYTVDASVDTTKYNKVLVWCVPFGVIFSYAEL